MKKRLVFLPIGLLLSILALVSCNLPDGMKPNYGFTPSTMITTWPSPTTSPGQMKTNLPPGITEAYIETVLQHSTKIVDAAQDWILHKPEIDNPVIYPVDFGDINNMMVGVDSEYFYIKLTLNGMLPGKGKSFPQFNGDPLLGFGANIGLDSDNNPHSGCISDGGTEIMTGYGIKSENGAIHTNWLSFMIDPTGTETPEDARYANRMFIQGGQYGGEGQSYFIISLPLAPMKLTKGQEISLNAWVEVASQQYDHGSFDVLCPQSRVDPANLMTCPIKIKLGEESVVQ